MLLVLSPAKALDVNTAAPYPGTAEPTFLIQATQLVTQLKTYSPAQLAELMKISDALARLNFVRFAQWAPPFNASNAKAAIFTFDGDVYGGLQALHLEDEALNYLQQHVCILSGLYGILRPLDWIQPYRLEMGCPLPNIHGRDLYAFWGTQLTEYLRTTLATQASTQIINLASQEYWRSIQAAHLGAQVITPVFQSRRGDQYKVISLYAKRARGLMARFAAQQGCQHAEELQAFAMEGYAFSPTASTSHTWVFRRETD